MEVLSSFLPIVIYCLLIALIIIAIIIGMKIIIAMERVNRIMDNVESKVNSLNSAFNMIEGISSGLNTIYVKAGELLIGSLKKIFNKNKESEEDEDE